MIFTADWELLDSFFQSLEGFCVSWKFSFPRIILFLKYTIHGSELVPVKISRHTILWLVFIFISFWSRLRRLESKPQGQMMVTSLRLIIHVDELRDTRQGVVRGRYTHRQRSRRRQSNLHLDSRTKKINLLFGLGVLGPSVSEGSFCSSLIYCHFTYPHDAFPRFSDLFRKFGENCVKSGSVDFLVHFLSSERRKGICDGFWRGRIPACDISHRICQKTRQILDF